MATQKKIAAHLREFDVLLPIIDQDGEYIFDSDNKQMMSIHREKIWIPSLKIDMHPLEEAEILSYFEMNNHESIKPRKLKPHEENDIIINEGLDRARDVRREYEQSLISWELEHQPYVEKHKAALNAYQVWADSSEGENHYKQTRTPHINNAIQLRINEINSKISEEIQRRKADFAARETKKAEVQAQIAEEQVKRSEAMEAQRTRMALDQIETDAKAAQLEAVRIERNKRLHDIAQAELQRLALEKSAYDAAQLDLLARNQQEAEKVKQDVENERIAAEEKRLARERLKAELND